MGTVHDLRLFQMGEETVHGTIVPTTSKCAVDEIAFEPTDLIYRPRIARGLVVRNTGFETPVQRGTKFTIPSTPANYEQLQNWLSMAIAGITAPTGAGPYVWLFTRNPAIDPAPSSWSLERRITDGTTPKDNKWGYCLASKIGFSAKIGEAMMFTLEGFARRVQAATLTAAQSMPSIEIPPVALCKMFIDSTYGTIGSTQVTGQLLDWSLDFTTGLFPIFTQDARTDMDFTAYGFDSSLVQVSFKATMLVAGQYALEKTAAEAMTLRAVRIEVDGTSSRVFKLDFLAKHTLGSVFKVGDQNGQDIVEFDMQEATDGTNLLVASLTNNIAALAQLVN